MAECAAANRPPLRNITRTADHRSQESYQAEDAAAEEPQHKQPVSHNDNNEPSGSLGLANHAKVLSFR